MSHLVKKVSVPSHLSGSQTFCNYFYEPKLLNLIGSQDFCNVIYLKFNNDETNKITWYSIGSYSFISVNHFSVFYLL